MTPAPHRCYEVALFCGGDTWDDVRSSLQEALYHVMDHGETCNSVMGSPSSNHRIEISHDPTMTHETYFKLVDAYLAERNARKQEQTNDSQ